MKRTRLRTTMTTATLAALVLTGGCGSEDDGADGGNAPGGNSGKPVPNSAGPASSSAPGGNSGSPGANSGGGTELVASMAADGANVRACRDLKCEIYVPGPLSFPITPKYGPDKISILEIGPDGVTVKATGDGMEMGGDVGPGHAELFQRHRDPSREDQ